MRKLLTRCTGLGAALIGASLLVIQPVLAVEGDTVADAVLGQPDFTSNACNTGNIGARSLCEPSDVAMDPISGRLFVADTGNSRILSWPNTRRFGNAEPADLVLGRPNFTIGGLCAEPTSATLCAPTGVAVDTDGRVYVADSNNRRVLRFDRPLSNGQDAALVLGQRDFNGNQEADYCFSSTPTDPSGTPFVCTASGVAASRQGAVWVSNMAGSFAVRFTRPDASFERSDLQIGGQTGGGPLSLGGSCVVFTLCEPRALALDAQGRVWIADTAKRRVVRFVVGSDSTMQDLVIGRPNPGLGQTPIEAALECEIAVRADNVCFPEGVAVDTVQRILVADTQHHRVLRFDRPAKNFPSANLVIGQPDFTTGGDSGCTATTAAALCNPRGLEVDFRGDVFVADARNNRVLRFDQPSSGTQPPTGTRSVGAP